MAALSEAGGPARPRTAIPTSAFTHPRSRVCGDGLTLQVVRPLVGTGDVLGLVDDPGLGSGRVQLVLTTHGPVATHSVWHDHGLAGGDLRELAAEAAEHAVRATALLAAVGIDATQLPVRPVVVVWGPDETDVPAGGRLRHDVAFVRGGELAVLLCTYRGHDDARSTDAARDLSTRLTARLAARPEPDPPTPVSSATYRGA